MQNSKVELQRTLLHAYRTEMCVVMHTQPFTVYKNEEIAAILAAQPKTISELAKIKGFPLNGVKIERYGATIVEIINNPTQINNFVINKIDGEYVTKTELKKLNAF